MVERGLNLGTVLVVDDDAGICRYVQTVLKRVGYDVDAAGDGESAIEILKSKAFDLVITDLTMPNVGGMEVLESIKAAGVDTDVLVMSAAGSIALAVQAIKLGAINYVEKPIESRALLDEVRSAFRQRKERALGKTLTPSTPGAPRRISNTIPPTVGRYRIERLLGSGGMGKVYVAFDPQLDRTVAIKTIQPPDTFGDQQTLTERFIREARSAAQLTHPNIAAIYDFGTDEISGLLYFAMERVDGLPINTLLAREGPLSVSRTIKVAYQVADALEFAHRRGIVHRDVKPSNVVVGEGDQAKLLDFGVAHIQGSDLTRCGSLLGSPAYVSPEAVTGGTIDYRSDQFSLGILILETVSNRRIFLRDDVVETLRLVAHVAVPTLSELHVEAPAKLQEVIDRLTSKFPEARYPEEMELLAELSAVGEALGLRLQPAVPRPTRH